MKRLWQSQKKTYSFSVRVLKSCWKFNKNEYLIGNLYIFIDKFYVSARKMFLVLFRNKLYFHWIKLSAKIFFKQLKSTLNNIQMHFNTNQIITGHEKITKTQQNIVFTSTADTILSWYFDGKGSMPNLTLSCTVTCTTR